MGVGPFSSLVDLWTFESLFSKDSLNSSTLLLLSSAAFAAGFGTFGATFVELSAFGNRFGISPFFAVFDKCS